jgi:uncharacterized protein
MHSFFSQYLTASQILIFYVVAVLIGMSKTGVHGAGMVAVPLLAGVFGGQLSSGILLPILCLADLLGVWYYHRHASWEHLKKLFPAAALGTMAGTYVGNSINDSIFKIIMAITIIGSVGIMVWLERGRREDIPGNKWFGPMTGMLGGFTSMVGNLAGSVMAVYFLSMRLPKNAFIGTTAWFFLVMNLFKVPFHIFSWHTITVDSVLMDLTTFPAIAVGAALGIVIVKKLSEKNYRWFIIAMTLIAAAFMLVQQS